MCLLAWSKRVAKRFSDVRMPPLGPREYSFITFLYFTCIMHINFQHEHRKLVELSINKASS